MTSANINAMSKSNDNVLFSVSDTEAGWHTDGASKDRVYDVVSLLCISPAAEGGKFRISNACELHHLPHCCCPNQLVQVFFVASHTHVFCFCQ